MSQAIFPGFEAPARTRVVHVRRAPWDKYVGRPFAEFINPGRGNEVPGRFGNPFPPGGNNAQALRRWLQREDVPEPTRQHFLSWLAHVDFPELLNSKNSIDAFGWYLRERCRVDTVFLADVRGLKGLALACWCAPEPCHAGVYVEFLEEGADGSEA